MRQKKLGPHGLKRVSVVLHTTPEWLLRGEGAEEMAPAPMGISTLPEAYEPRREEHGSPSQSRSLAVIDSGRLSVVNVVDADSWRVRSAAPPQQPTILGADTRYQVPQFAVELGDNSANRVAHKGDLLHIAQLGPPRSGDIVLFSRTPNNNKELVQYGVRRVQFRDGGLELNAESSDPRFSAPFAVDPRTMRMNDGSVISIDGILIGLYRSIA